MKYKLKIIIIGFLAGLSGSYAFYLVMPVKETVIVEKQGYQQSFTNHQAAATSEDFVAASNQGIQSVVFIKSKAISTQETGWWDWFFNQRSSQAISSGSGVIFSNDGYIVTNNHVISGSEAIEVIHNKRSYIAKIVGTDPSTDIALLKIEASNLPNIPLGKSKDTNVGEWVIAIGNPFNLTSTVTAGIISAKGRDINILEGQFPIESFIQTDAVINPGNSGGALVNKKGELIGINTAILSRTGSYNGYGFAVPVDIVLKVVNDLIKYGEVQKAFFGTDVINIDNETATKLNLNDFSGVLVSYIEQDGAAAKAGLQKGDVILKIDGENIESKSGFNEKLSYYKPGDRITVTYKRDNKSKDINLVLTNIEGTTSLIKKELFTSDFLGADLEIVPKVERDRLGIQNGVRIKKLRNGFLRRLQISEGFIITTINKKPVMNVADLNELLENLKGRVIIEGVNNKGVKGYYSYYF